MWRYRFGECPQRGGLSPHLIESRYLSRLSIPVYLSSSSRLCHFSKSTLMKILHLKSPKEYFLTPFKSSALSNSSLVNSSLRVASILPSKLSRPLSDLPSSQEGSQPINWVKRDPTNQESPREVGAAAANTWSHHHLTNTHSVQYHEFLY